MDEALLLEFRKFLDDDKLIFTEPEFGEVVDWVKAMDKRVKITTSVCTGAAVLAYAGVLELGQMYIPGRHAALLDWLASSSGVLCACLTGSFFRDATT